MLKQWLDAGKCLLGAHQGDWAFEAHGNCSMVQTCRVCGQISRRVEHLWTAWSLAADGACDWARSCTRCSESEARVEHEWSEWRYRAARSCEQGRQCERCSAWADDSQSSHLWGVWAYSERHRGPVRECARCAQRQSAFTGEIEPTEDEPTGDEPEPPVAQPAAEVVAAASFRTQVDDIVEAVSAEITTGKVDAQTLPRATARLEALTIETEDDRRAYVSGFLRVMDVVIPAVPPEAGAILSQQRMVMQSVFDRMYGRPDSAYLVTTRIIQELAEGLISGGTRGELVAKAFADLDAVTFNESDDDFRLNLWSRMRISALGAAHSFSERTATPASTDDPLAGFAALVHEVRAGEKFELRPFVDAALGTIDKADDGVNDSKTIAAAVLPIVGVALMMNSSASPVFEPVRDRLIAITLRGIRATASSESAPQPVQSAPAAPPPLPAHYAAILAGYSIVLENDGFSEYAFQHTLDAMKELPDDSPDATAFQEAMRRLIDMSLPYAPTEAAQALAALRDSLADLMNAATDEGEELTSDEALRRAERVLEQFQTGLAAGEPPAAAFIKAQMAIQALAMRMRQDDEETGQALMSMLMRLPEMILPYAPEAARQQSGHIFEDLMPAMNTMLSGMNARTDDPVERAVLQRQVRDHLNRVGRVADVRDAPESSALPPHLRQFLELYPVLSERILNPAMGELAESERAEADRMRKRIDSPTQLIRYARTEDEFIRAQRQGFRRTVLEFRQFERRHHLMLVYPPFPTEPTTLDANSVFFSGSDPVASIVNDACRTIGMSLPQHLGLANRIHGRWQQLRGAGLAVFDYSDDDISRADPVAAHIPQRDAEASILSAAGPVASVAYETGWAYVLGKPMVILGRQGGSVPFDVDVEPVLLAGDGRDAERVTAAIQTGLYGAPHGIAGSSLAETIEHVRQRHGDSEDSETRALVAALSDRDAVRARMLLAEIVEKVSGHRPMVAIPTFPGRYPAASGHLFHVTAFRDWTAVAQEETRAACRRAGVEYRIGSDRLRPDILREVWDDLCGASLVVADITNLNANAALELAIAHALGRPTLILTQNHQPHSYFPAIAKVRTHRYDPDRGRQALASLLDAFIGAEVRG